MILGNCSAHIELQLWSENNYVSFLSRSDDEILHIVQQNVSWANPADVHAMLMKFTESRPFYSAQKILQLHMFHSTFFKKLATLTSSISHGRTGRQTCKENFYTVCPLRHQLSHSLLPSGQTPDVVDIVIARNTSSITSMSPQWQTFVWWSRSPLYNCPGGVDLTTTPRWFYEESQLTTSPHVYRRHLWRHWSSNFSSPGLSLICHGQVILHYSDESPKSPSFGKALPLSNDSEPNIIMSSKCCSM